MCSHFLSLKAEIVKVLFENSLFGHWSFFSTKGISAGFFVVTFWGVDCSHKIAFEEGKRSNFLEASENFNLDFLQLQSTVKICENKRGILRKF